MWNFYVLKWANSCPILKSFEQFSRASKHNNPVMRLSPCSQVFKSSASRDTHSGAAIILISGRFSGECCQLRVISGMGDLDDVYSLKAEVADKPEEICVDGCVYTRWDLSSIHLILTWLYFLGQTPLTLVKNIASKMNNLQDLLNARWEHSLIISKQVFCVFCNVDFAHANQIKHKFK